MRRHTYFMWFLAILCIIVVAPALLAQQAVVQVVAFSPQEIHDLNISGPPSNGLRVVGKGEVVYLKAMEAGGEEVTAYNWSFASLPAGSQAVLDSTDKMMTTFVPDTTGEFVVKCEITTASGVDDTTLTIVSAKYVGVGGSAVDSRLPGADVAAGQCALCHSAETEGWKATGHASFFKVRLDNGPVYYSESCIECHTVGYDTLASAVNGGFDDVAKELNWTFPAVKQAGNWDSLVTHYPDLAQKANIQCENCHGPGSLHKGDPGKIDFSLDEGVCGKCHEEEPYHVKNLQWKQSGHAIGVGFAATRDGCNACHSGYGFIKRVDPDTKFAEDKGFPQISCAVCHDPHGHDNPKQLRKVEDVTLNNGEVVSFGGNARFCMSCHISRRNAETYVTEYHEHYGPHHSNQTDMIAGTNAITFGMHIPSSNHKNVVQDLCITCHMAPTPAEGMPGHNMVGEHTFKIKYEDPATNEVVENLTACKSCHGNVSSLADFIAKEDYDGDGTIEPVQDEVKGLLDKVGKLLPPVGDPAVNVSPDYTPVQLMAAYNYAFVEDDGSFGIHNLQYAVNLLRVAYAALTTGDVGAGQIQEIVDVPNDQGKQVRVVWERFGGDGVGDMPIQFYALWRRVDDMGLGKKAKDRPIFESLAAIPRDLSKLENGAFVLMGNELWDFAGQVPAAGMDMYSAIAPTLFDSTKTDGMHWSVFVVSGHTANPSVYAVSEPDSGYSVDNLAPTAPANLSAVETQSGVVLSWDEPVDEDFKYFAVYRSTEPNFDPSGMAPIATATENTILDADVSVNNTYYYKVSAFDFAGNQSKYSQEVSLLVTSVTDNPMTVVPDEFTLQQNYPNPFNPSTEITFGLPESGHVTLTIYNLLGHKVRTLVSSNLNAGYHRVVWDARDDAGQEVAPGMYIYRLESGSQTLTRKMVLLK